jgi:hypothetical protein
MSEKNWIEFGFNLVWDLIPPAMVLYVLSVMLMGSK